MKIFKSYGEVGFENLKKKKKENFHHVFSSIGNSNSNTLLTKASIVMMMVMITFASWLGSRPGASLGPKFGYELLI